MEELESIRMVESEIDGQLLQGPTEGSQEARTILAALGIAVPKAALTTEAAAHPQQEDRSAESTLF